MTWLDPLLRKLVYVEGTLSSPERVGIDLRAGAGISLATQDDPALKARRVTFTSTAASAFDWKDSVRGATTAALPANTRVGNVITADANGALPTIDGLTFVVDETLLVQDEVAQLDNGIYEITAVGDGSNPFVLTRRSDADTDADVTAGLVVKVSEGTANGGKAFALDQADPITINTTALTFSEFGGGGGGGGLTAPANPADNGKWAVANNGDLVYVTSVTSVTGIAFASGNINWSTNEVGIQKAGNSVLTTNTTETRVDGFTTLALRISGTAVLSFTSALATLDVPTLNFGAAVVSPMISQADVADVVGDDLLVQAQSNDSATLAPGNLLMGAGINQGAGPHGNVQFQTDGTTRATLTDDVLTMAASVALAMPSATPAASAGTIRLAKDFTVNVRNNADSGDLGVISYAAGANILTFGDNSVIRVEANSSFSVYVTAAARLVVDTTKLDLLVPGITFRNTVTAPTLSQVTHASTPQTMTMQAMNVTTGIGSDLNLTSGTGSTRAGAARLQAGAESLVEATELVAGQRIVALCLAADLTTTEMPASTGDGVLFFANANTVPTADPVGGGIVYVESGALKYRGTSGTVTTLAVA